MVTIDCADPAKLAPFWTEALGAKVIQDMDGDYMIMATGADGGVLLGLQRVPEAKNGKNRVHLDLHTEDRQADVQRLVGLGATVIGEHDAPGFAWTVLTDPDGNEFCIGGEVK
jgi:predicted enzyme related to lactoylglutathione lyase